MSGGYTQVPRSAVAAVGVAVLLGSGALTACSSTAAPADQKVSSGASSTPRTTDPVAAKAAAEKAAALKAATDRAAAEQAAAVKAAGAKYSATQARGEAALAKLHPLAKAAAACGIPVGDIQPMPRGSRIGMPDVPKRGNMWHVKKTSPISPGMIIYWPDGGSVLCR
jgi:hypothetical protein